MNSCLADEKMHDWTLSRISVSWKKRECEFEFVTSSSVVRLIASGLVQLVVPIREPWGASESVNSIVEQKLNSDNICRLDLEMQSGDVITIQAASFEYASS